MAYDWNQEAWTNIADIYDAIINHPFVKGLADGTLPRDRFDFYIRQDSLYLRSYFRVLAHIASRIDNIAYADDFIRFAADGIAVEQALHSSILSASASKTTEAKSPSCTLYTSVLLSQAMEPVEVEVAAILPCFCVYQKVGEHILASVTDIAANPYRQWIETYADKAFAESTQRAVDIANHLAERASQPLRERMTSIFRLCSRMEWLFWDSAWNLEKWKI